MVPENILGVRIKKKKEKKRKLRTCLTQKHTMGALQYCCKIFQFFFMTTAQV